MGLRLGVNVWEGGVFEHADFLSSGGEMEKRIRAFDWSKTSLGLLENWPSSLKHAVSTCLVSGFATVLYCGPESILIYNDAFIPIAGKKHPSMLGLPAKEARSEIWPILEPLIKQALTKGITTKKDNKLQLLDRGGFLEETYLTCSFSPVGVADGKINSVIETLSNTTHDVLHHRHLQTLKNVAEHASSAKTLEEACKITLEALTGNDADIPFALLYLLDHPPGHAILKGNVRLTDETQAPADIKLEDVNSVWPLARIIKTGKSEILDIKHFNNLPKGRWEKSPQQAVAVPLFLPGHHRPTGIFIVGVNPMRVCDDDYLNFYNSLAQLIVNALANASAFTEECRRLEAMKELDRAKTVFFNDTSHEFRTPLQLILGPITDALTDSEQPLPPRQLERLTLIQRNALRLLKLTNSLLDFSRIEAGRLHGNYETTDLAKLTGDVADLFREAIERAGLQFNVDVSSPDEPVYVDRSMWEKILFNLLSNAFRYTLKGSITLQLKKEQHQAVMTVSDTGIGIPEKELPKIFERFYRVEGATGRGYEGSGIGLALAQELTKLHGGSIKATSKFNEGSVFTVTIPLGHVHLPANQIQSPSSATCQIGVSLLGTAYVQEALAWLEKEAPAEETEQKNKTAFALEPLPTKKPETKASFDKAKVLFAEDNPDMRNYMRGILAPHYEVHIAIDGEVALEMALNQKFDFILTDYRMPKLTGMQLIQALRANEKTKHIPIIILSSSANEEERVSSLERGADDYIAKPFSSRELLARIKIHRELARLRERLEKSVQERTRALEEEVAKHKQTEDALIKSEESYRMLAKISPVGIFHTDKEGKTFYTNQRLSDMWGAKLKSDEIKQETWKQFLHPEDKDRAVSLWDKFCKREIEHFKCEHRFLKPDGSVVWVIAEAVPEEDNQGQMIGFIGTVTDITELKELEKKHRKQQDQFIDNMCHELRNPLNGIYGSVTLEEENIATLQAILASEEAKDLPSALKEKILKHIEQDKEATQAIDRCARHQKTIADDVLNLSKLEAGMVALNPEDYDAEKAIKNVIAIVDTEITRKNIKLYKNIAHQNTKINSDPNRLAQVLLNLLTNAIKFTPEKGEITISLQVLEETADTKVLEFSVKDSGMGLTAEEQAQLFNRFVQVGQFTPQGYGGSGLGLIISKNLVELMGGAIQVDCKKWKGCKFTFTIRGKPVAQEEKPESQASALAPPKRKATPKIKFRALVVEDNPINQKLLVRLLGPDCHCHVANNGKEAVEMFEKVPIDIIFMDIQMPEMDGLQAAKKIRELERKRSLPTAPIPIIALSGNAREEHINTARQAGMNDYLVKPYEKSQLFERINHYLKDKTPASETIAASSVDPDKKLHLLTT